MASEQAAGLCGGRVGCDGTWHAFDDDGQPLERPVQCPGLRAGVAAGRPAGIGTGYRSTRLSDVEPERVSWLWERWLPQGKVVTLDGDPGLASRP